MAGEWLILCHSTCVKGDDVRFDKKKHHVDMASVTNIECNNLL